MGNAPGKSTEPDDVKPCDVECRQEKQVKQTQASYQALASDPTADPVKRQAAYVAYMTALHGPAWSFQQQQAAATAKAASAPDPTPALEEEIAQLEEKLEKIESEIHSVADETDSVHADISKGQSFLITIRRAVELKKQYHVL